MTEQIADSIKNVPSVIKQIKFKPGTINLDWGGGKYNNVTKFLGSKGVLNLVYDPLKRSKKHNKKVFNKLCNIFHGGADTITMCNVLNILPNEVFIRICIYDAVKWLKTGGIMYISVYEGNRTGKATKYQANKRLYDYVKIVTSACRMASLGMEEKFTLSWDRQKITVTKVSK